MASSTFSPLPSSSTAASLAPIFTPIQPLSLNASLPSVNPLVSPVPLLPSPVSSIPTPAKSIMGSGFESKMNMKMALIVFVVLTIITILIMGYLAKNYLDTQDTLNTSAWNSFPTAGAVLLFLAMLVSSYFTYSGFSNAQGYDKNLIMISYIAILILFIIAFTLFWRKGNYSGAFYVSLAIVALSILLTYFSWKSNKMAGYGQLPLVIMSVVFACYCYDVTSKNHNNCGEIDGITSNSSSSSSKKDESDH